MRPSPPSRTSSKQPSTKHHRLIFHAQSLLGTEKSDQLLKSEASQIPGGAYRPSQPPETVSTPREINKNFEGNNPFESITVTRDYQPTHLTKDDVRHARKLFRGILETTEGLLSNAGSKSE